MIGTTNYIYQAEDENMVLNLVDKNILIEIFDKDYDGIFPNQASWTRFSNSVNDEGTYYLAKKLAYKGTEKQIKNNNDGTITITYLKPIKGLTGYKIINRMKEAVISDITEITVELEYEWHWRKNDATASMIEIYGKVKNYN